MSCCSDKNILKILRGTKALSLYITLEGLGDWDLLNPPSGKEYEVWITISRPSGAVSAQATIANSDTVSFTLDAYQEGNTFWDLGTYGLVVKVYLWDVPHGVDPVAAKLFEVDTCIYIYEKAECPPIC